MYTRYDLAHTLDSMSCRYPILPAVVELNEYRSSNVNAQSVGVSVIDSFVGHEEYKYRIATVPTADG